MKRFVLPLIAIALSVCPVLASELSSAQAAKQVKQVPFPRQTGVQEDEIAIQAIPQPMPAHRPLHVLLYEFLDRPIKPIMEYLDSPNSGLRRLLNESDNLRKAREHLQRFWTSSASRPF
jgi:hypothetical protein